MVRDESGAAATAPGCPPVESVAVVIGKVHTVEQTPGYKDMFPDGSDVVLVIRTAKTTATWYKTSNGYYITADPIGQEAIQAVRLVESDEEIARSAKAPPPIGAVLQALIRCSQQGSRPSAPAHPVFQLGARR